MIATNIVIKKQEIKITNLHTVAIVRVHTETSIITMSLLLFLFHCLFLIF